MTEDECSLVLAETPGLKRIIEENEAFNRAQFWGGLFRASEAYFADGLSGMGIVQEGKGEGEDSGRVVEPSGGSAAGECGSVGSAGLGSPAVVLWVFASFGVCLVVCLLSVLFGWRGV